MSTTINLTTAPVSVPLLTGNQLMIVEHVGGDMVYYRSTSNVGPQTNDGVLLLAQITQFYAGPVWFASASTAQIIVTYVASPITPQSIVAAGSAAPGTGSAGDVFIVQGDGTVGRSKFPLSIGPPASGTSDDSALLQAFLNGLPSGYGALFTQPYKVASAVTIPNGVQIYGLGSNGGAIQATGNNYIFNWPVGGAGGHNRISGLYLNAAAAQSAGGAFDFANVGSDIDIDHLLIGDNLFYTFDMRPTVNGHGHFHISHITFNDVSGHNVPFKLGNGTNLVTDIYVHDVLGIAKTNADVAKWWEILNNVDTLYVHDCNFYQGTAGIALGQNATGSVTGSKWSHVSLDTASTSGLVINKCRSLDWTDCTVTTIGTSGATPGIQIAALAVGVNIKGGLVQNCYANGIEIQAGSQYTDVLGVQVSDNNRGGAAFGVGITALANTTEFNIVSCRSGNFLLGANTQQRGIWVVAGTSNFYTVVNNRTPGNTTSGLTDGGTGVNKTVTGNL